MSDSDSGEFKPVDASWNAPTQTEPTSPGSGLIAYDSGRRGHVVGVARQVKERSEAGASIWDFILDRYDTAGNRLPPMPVELRGQRIVGRVNEGDWVEVKGPWRKGETRVVKQVRDITTQTIVRQRGPSVAPVIALVIFLIVVVAFIVRTFVSGHEAIPLIPQGGPPATLMISPAGGPSGTSITVTGHGYASGETVEILFHADTVGTATAAQDGSFQSQVTVPSFYSAFRGTAFEVMARGQRSFKSAQQPFTIR